MLQLRNSFKVTPIAFSFSSKAEVREKENTITTIEEAIQHIHIDLNEVLEKTRRNFEETAATSAVQSNVMRNGPQMVTLVNLSEILVSECERVSENGQNRRIGMDVLVNTLGDFRLEMINFFKDSSNGNLQYLCSKTPTLPPMITDDTKSNEMLDVNTDDF